MGDTTSIFIPFRSKFKIPMLTGVKTMTCRTQRYGKPGHLFTSFGREFVIVGVDEIALGIVTRNYWRQEGFTSEQDFVDFWNVLYPTTGYNPSQIVYLHRFHILDKQDE